MKILINSPSLDFSKNVSGISSIVSLILKNGTHQYFTVEVGKDQKCSFTIFYYFRLFVTILCLPIVIVRSRISLFHQNLPFDKKGIFREWIIARMVHLFNVPILLHIHGGEYFHKDLPWFYNYLAKDIFQISRKVVVLGIFEQNRIKDIFNFIPCILPNCIDESALESKISTIKNSKVKFLYLGRIEESKGIMELIRALKVLYIEKPFVFLLCGEGSLRDLAIKELSALMGDDFIYYGVVTGNEKSQIIKNSDFFVLPSHFEGMPISLLESMYSGVVPIITRVGVIHEVVINDKNGFLIPVRNEIKLQDALVNAINLTNDKYTDMSENCMNTIRSMNTSSGYFENLNALYTLSLQKG